jgi:magnesium transporter
MIRVWCAGRSACEQPVDPAVWVMPPDAVWIDLVQPTREEENAVEKALGLSVPTREEMAELEASSRIYRENGATYATADIVTHGDEEIPGIQPVTFVVTAGPLVTVRYVDPKPFAMMVDKLSREPHLCATGPELFLNLMETIVDRVSDILSGTVVRVEGIAGHVFSGGKTVGFERLITKLGRAQMTNARIERASSPSSASTSGWIRTRPAPICARWRGTPKACRPTTIRSPPRSISSCRRRWA